MFIEQPSFYLRMFYPHALWRKNKNEKVVYLTFDDGPIPEVTPWVLDVLRENGVKATFFCVGDNVRKHPEVFEMLKAEGHQIRKDRPFCCEKSILLFGVGGSIIILLVLLLRHLGQV